MPHNGMTWQLKFVPHVDFDALLPLETRPIACEGCDVFLQLFPINKTDIQSNSGLFQLDGFPRTCLRFHLGPTVPRFLLARKLSFLILKLCVIEFVRLMRGTKNGLTSVHLLLYKKKFRA